MRISTIRTRFTLYIVAFTTIILFIVVSYIINLYTNKMLDNMKEISNLHLELVTGELDNAIASNYQLFQKIQDNDELQELMERNVNEVYTDAMKKQDVSEILRDYAYGDISVISVLLSNHEIKIEDPFYQLEPYSSIVSSYEPLNSYLLNKEPTFTKIGRFPLKFEYEEGIDTITFIDELLSKEDFSSLGTLLITSKVDYMFKEFVKSCEDNFDLVYIVNQENAVVYKTGIETLTDSKELYPTIYAAVTEEAESGLVDYRDSTYYFNTQNIDFYDEWSIIGVKEYTELQSNYRDVTNALFVFGLMSVPVLIGFSYLYARRITGPIVELNGAMKEFAAGEWPETIKINSNDEMEELVNRFNEMVEEQFKLIEQIVQEQENSKQKEVETIQLKLELLQSQINPHFIHNTLNAISYLVRNNKNEEADHMLKAFNVLLRGSMSRQRDVIELREEIECVKSYAEIQKVRYNDIFRIEYQIDPTLNNLTLPKLTIQPLVENAIYHGIVPKGVPGMVKVMVVRNNEHNIVVQVEDDGIGMKYDDEVKVKSSFNGISFDNINKRLKLIYGDETKLQITSVQGEGTKVSFIIKDRGDGYE